MKSKSEIELVLAKSNKLEMNQALSLLDKCLSGIDGLCHKCIDEILIPYKENRGNIDYQMFSEKVFICRALEQHKDEIEEFF